MAGGGWDGLRGGKAEATHVTIRRSTPRQKQGIYDFSLLLLDSPSQFAPRFTYSFESLFCGMSHT